MKRTCSQCGNKAKRLMEYVELWGGLQGQYPDHFGYRCKLCGHFWEIVITQTKPL